VAGALVLVTFLAAPVDALSRVPGDLPPDAPALEEVGPDAETFDDRKRPEAAPWVERPLALEAVLGLGAPLGLAGVAVDMSPSPGFSANAGAGIGGSTRSLQLAAALRMRIIAARGFAAGAEGGLAVGRYSEDLSCPSGRCPAAWYWERAVWGNVGLFLELRTDAGLALRGSFGASAIFNVTSGQCVRCDATDEPSLWTTTLPYTAIAVGYAFLP
jgi:hypothetical protein